LFSIQCHGFSNALFVYMICFNITFDLVHQDAIAMENTVTLLRQLLPSLTDVCSSESIDAVAQSLRQGAPAAPASSVDDTLFNKVR
jgi:hypothetical protein